MTHPGLAMMLVVGVGLGAMLYYFFASPASPHGEPIRQPRLSSYNRTGLRTPEHNSGARNRRPDTKCMICLDDADKDMDAVRVIPCSHVFHKLCINEWRSNGIVDARNCCPNCRDNIQDLEEL